MSDRDLTEPQQAMRQLLIGLRDGQQRTRSRQRWQGAIQLSAIGSGSSTANGSQVTLASVVLDPGSWALFVRVGWEISSSAGTPTFVGDERTTVRLRTYEPDTANLLETVDQETKSPAVVADTALAGVYADSVLLLGSISYDDETEVHVEGIVLSPAGGSGLVSWHASKIMALPF